METTTIIQNPDGSSSIQITPAPVTPAAIVLTQIEVSEKIQEFTKQVAVCQQALTDAQNSLTKYQGYLTQFPAPVTTPPTPTGTV